MKWEKYIIQLSPTASIIHPYLFSDLFGFFLHFFIQVPIIFLYNKLLFFSFLLFSQVNPKPVIVVGFDW